MKKLLCVVLSVILVFSSFGVVALAADESGTKVNLNFDFSLSDLVDEKDFSSALQNYTFDESSIPDKYKNEGKYDMEQLVTSGTADDVYMYGLSLDFLYNSEEKFLWSMLPTSSDPYCSDCEKAFAANTVTDNVCPNCGGKLKTDTVYNDMTLACGNLNVCLTNMLTKHYGDGQLFTNENATLLCNFIGHLLYPNYVDQYIGFTYGLAEDDEDEFYDTIAEKSGLTDLIQKNWCDNRSVNFKPLIYTLGVQLSSFPVPDRDIYNGKIVARLLLKAIINSLMNQGPVNYLLDVVWAFSRTYSTYLSDAVKAIFRLKINAGMIDPEELMTFKGLLNLIFNDNDPTDETKLQFITPPSRRFALAETKTELFLYVIIYLNLVGKNGSNPEVIENLKADISANTVLTDVEKERLITIVGGIFCGRLNDMVPMLANFFITNISEAKDTIWQTFVKMLRNLIHSFVSVFDKIYQNFKSLGSWGKA